MVLKKSNIHFFVSIVFALYSYVISDFLFNYYTLGDQLHYTDFYLTLKDYNLTEGYRYYNSRLGAGEPLYFLLVFFFNSVISKIVLFSTINAVFAFFLSFGLLKVNMHPILLILLGFNFYLLVLFIPAERLKVSLLLFVISLFMMKKKKTVFQILSIFTHFQTLILLLTQQADKIADLLKSLLAGKRFNKIISLLGICIALMLFLSIFQDILSAKISGYSENMSYSNIIKPSIFLILTLIYRKGKMFQTFLIHVPIIIAAFIVGESRLVIFSFFVFLFYGVQVKRGLNAGVIFSLFYFSLNGFEFIKDVLENGTGF